MSTKLNDGGMIYPMPPTIWKNSDGSESVAFDPRGGMSLRDYLAAKSLQALITVGGGGKISFTAYAEDSYAYADAMLVERAKGGEQ